jgi:putative redox protein
MTDPSLRGVQLTRIDLGRYQVTNSRGTTIEVGDGADVFSPVELLLAAIAGCSAIDVDHITSRRAEPVRFEVETQGHKVRDDAGNHLTDLQLRFTVTFPEGETGDAAREMLPRAVTQSHDRLCTVSRTVELGTRVEVRVDGEG